MKKKLSILIYSLANGGAERVVSILLNTLKEKYEITLFLMNDTVFYDISEEIKIVYLEKSNPNESGIKKLLKLPFLAWKLKKYNKNNISISFMNRANYINILAKIFGMKSRVIISERAMPSFQHANGIQGKINRFLIKNLYSKADLIIANSKGNTCDLIENFNCKKVETINNPIDLEKIKELSSQKVEFRDDSFTFITIGRLDKGKNHKLMIDAMQNIEAKLYIIGDGELKDELENHIKSLSLENKVTLLGKQINPYKFLKQADCFLFSSNYEGFPNVLLEALACNLPIISTDCKSGPREILSPNSDINFKLDKIEISEYGILVPINDCKNLTKSMNIIINNKILRERYKEKTLKRVEYYSLDKIVKKFEDNISA
ncbi:glycosyltransferase [Halarcobacter bivalviorum]|uniref:glycosyltransferase n=1 Tax=Halarcobacter bivalviorum TaxID=663364 RepID=UPI00100AF1B6|nr:glycosyltransferase [Halarcobacter bivalviorum]RXK07212.1 glycosyl transferase [Halarcobacter bivalviorum]